MGRNGKTIALCFSSVLVIALVAAVAAPAQTNPEVKVQQACKAAGGVLYTARDSPDAPAICHKKGAPVSSDESLEGWEAILFVEGQL